MKKNIKKITITLVLLIGLLSILILNKEINIDRYKGKVKVTNVDIKTSGTKKEEIVTDDEIKEIETISSFSVIKYKISYKLETNTNTKRDAVIRVKLNNEDKKYVVIREINEENIKSRTTEDGIEIEIKNVETNKDSELEIEIEITNAPDEYKFNPIIEVKEKTSEKIITTAKEIEVKTTSIEGKIKSKTNEEINGIEVKICKINNEICEDEKSTYTDENGKYVISNIEEGSYKIMLPEGYELEEDKEIEISEGRNIKNIVVDQKGKFSASIKKYLEKVEVNGKKYEIKKSQKIAIPTKDKVKIKATYVFEIENISESEGYVKTIRENIPENFKLSDYDENKNWENIDGVYYNTSLKNDKLLVNDKKEVRIELESEKEISPAEYVNKVEILGESYHTVKYVVDDKVAREFTVSDEDKIDDYKYEKDGYDFDGWYETKEYKNKYDFSTKITKDTIIYGKLINNSAKEIKITYMKDENTIFDERIVKEGEKAENIVGPEKEGYNFLYWKKGNDQYLFNETLSYDITLYAEYEKKEYIVRFFIPGDYGVYKNVKNLEQTIKYEDKVSMPSEIELKYYNFIGWFDKNLENEFDFTTEIKENTDIYGKYEIKKYNITFYEEDKSTIINEQRNLAANEIIEIPDIPEKEGYTFKGFKKVDDDITYEFDESMLPTEDLKLYCYYEINSYNLKIDDKVNEVKNYTLNYNETKEIENPFKKMFVFKGWKISPEDSKSTIENTIFKMGIKDTLLEATYEIKKYNIEFYDEDKKTLLNNDTEFEANEIVTEATPKDKKYYHFDGWIDDEGNKIEIKNETVYELFERIEKENTLKLYATYKGDTYKVIYKDYDQSIIDEEEITYPNVVKKEEIIKQQLNKDDHYKGHTFKEFQIENEKVDFNNLINKCETKNNCVIEVTAVYDINVLGIIFYDINNKVTTVKVNYGETIKTKEIPNEEGKIGYHFLGWFEENESLSFDFNTQIEETKEVYAKYDANTYEIEFEKEEDYTGEMLNQFFKYDEIKKLTKNQYIKEGHTFKGWIDENDNKYIDEEEVINLSNENGKVVKLKAIFEPNIYELSFNSNSAESGEMPNQSFTYGKIQKISKNKYVKEGYTFIGWNKDKDETIALYEDEEEINISENTTLYAIWEINSYSLTIDTNGGTISIDSYKTLNYNEEITIPIPTKEGYTFDSWEKEGNGELNGNVFKMKTQDTTLTAKYRENGYILKYDSNTGKGIMEDDIFGYEVDENRTIKSNAFTKEGYNFIGWSNEKNGEVVYTGNESLKEFANLLEAEKEEEKTIYAVWSPINYTIIFDKDDDTLGEMLNQSFTYDEEKNLNKNQYVKEGYVFSGWQYNEAVLEDEQEVKNLTTEDNKEIHLKALFNINKYTVTFMNENNVYEVKENIEHGKTVSAPATNPKKEYNHFLGWKINGEDNLYDFNSIITSNLTLLSVYEEIEAPEIKTNPEEWTNEKVKVSLSNTNNYEMKIKQGSESYKIYTSEVEVEDNQIVRGKSIVGEEESSETIKRIDNIDKNSPEIADEIELDSRVYSVGIKSNATDELSGIKEVKLYIAKTGEYEEIESCYKEANITKIDNKNTGEKKYNYSCKVNGLEESTIYDAKIEYIDVAGNKSSKEFKIETSEMEVIARITSTGGNELEEPLRFESLEEALNHEYCLNKKCTIEMVKNTNESVKILENQDVILDLNGQTIKGVENVTITNEGTLQVIDTNNEFDENEEIIDYNPIGKIINDLPGSTAIHNSGILILGINEVGNEEDGSIVSTVEPYIEGAKIGIETPVDSKNGEEFRYYDGMIKGGVSSITGTTTSKPFKYNVNSQGTGPVISTLQILAEAVAKVKRTGVYYSTLDTAKLNTYSGEYTNIQVGPEEEIINLNYSNPKYQYHFQNDTEYKINDLSENENYGTILGKFNQDESGLYFDGNTEIKINTVADNLYNNFNETISLTINPDNKNDQIIFAGKYGYSDNISITVESGYICVNPTNNDKCYKLPSDFDDGNYKNITVTSQTSARNQKLYYNGEELTSYNSTYARKSYSYTSFYIGGGKNSPSWFKGKIKDFKLFKKELSIDEIKNIDNETDSLLIYYDFTNSENYTSKNMIINNNTRVYDTTAVSSVKLDLTNYEYDQIISFNISTSTIGTSYIVVKEENETYNEDYRPSYNDSDGRILYETGETYDKTIQTLLSKGKTYIIYYGYYVKNSSDIYGTDSYFKIYNIKVQNDESNYNDEIVYEANSNSEYHFEPSEINYYILKDLSGNDNDAKVYGTTRTNDNGLKFDGVNDYAIIEGGIGILQEETVEVEIQTSTSEVNQIIYAGSNQEKIALYLYFDRLTVSNDGSNRNFKLPTNFYDGNKHKITVTCENNNYIAYVDDKLLTYYSNSYNPSKNSNSYIGKISSNNYYFNTILYTLKVYNKALSEEEILQGTSDGLILKYDISDENGVEVISYSGIKSQSNIPLNKTANSYYIINTRKFTENKTLTVNARISSRGGSHYGYATLTTTEEVPTHNNQNGRFIYISGDIESKDYTTTLEPGKIYYLHFGYYKNSSSALYDDEFVINYIKIDDKEMQISERKLENSKVEYIKQIPIVNSTNIDNIELIKDLTIDEPLTIDETRNVVLDLKGHTLKTSQSDYIIKNTGSLKIIDSKYTDDLDDAKANYEAEVVQNLATYNLEIENYNNSKTSINENLSQDYYNNLETLTNETNELKQIQENYQNALDEYNSKYANYQVELEKYNEQQEKIFSGYVQNNLLLHLDGKKHGNSSTKWNDLSENNNDALINGATWTEDNGLSFNGNNSYVVLNEYNTPKFTWSVTFSAKKTNSFQNVIDNAEFGGCYIAILSNNKLNGSCHIDGEYKGFTTDYEIEDNKKYNANIIYDGEKLSFYVNNELIGSYEKNDTGLKYPNDSTYVLLGSDAEGNTTQKREYLNGTIYNAKIYDIALTKEEIEKNYYIDGLRYELENIDYSKINLDDAEELLEKPIEPTKPKVVTNGYNTNDYINDGIILHLDGIDHEDNKTIWNDLSENNNDALINGATWTEDNGLSFNGSDNNAQITNGISNSALSEETVEIIFSTTTTKNQVYYNGNSNQNIGIGTWDGYIIVTNKSQTYNTYSIPSNLADGYKHKITVIYKDNNYTAYFDNTLMNKIDTKQSWQRDSNLYIGRRGSYGPNYYQGNIYSLRVYNKALNNEELSLNDKVDKARYKLNEYPTSNSSNGLISSSSKSTDAYKSFDGNYESIYEGTTLNEETIEYNFNAENTIKSFKIYGTNDISKYPKKVIFMGSKNGINYDTILEETDLEEKGLNEYNEITLPENGKTIDSYKYYKWIFKNENNTISIGEIELEKYDLIKEEFIEYNNYNAQIDTNNFVYKSSKASNYSFMSMYNGYLTSTIDTGQSVTYYKDKIKIYEVTDDLKITANLRAYNNYTNYSNGYNSFNTGALYVGLSKTNDISTTDFEVYEKIGTDFGVNNAATKEYNFKVSEPGEYYFKMVLDYKSGYNIYVGINKLQINNTPTLKESVLKESTLTGNIDNNTRYAIYNDYDSELILDDIILNVNYNGSSSNYGYGISNYGDLKITENAVINITGNYNYGIHNGLSGKIDYLNVNNDLPDENKKIKITNSGRESIGIDNVSDRQKEFSNYNITNSTTSSKGFRTSKDTEFSKINVTGGVGAVIEYSATGTFDDTIVMNADYPIDTNSPNSKAIVNGSNITGQILVTNASKFILNSGTLNTNTRDNFWSSGNYDSDYSVGNIEINGGTITNNGYSFNGVESDRSIKVTINGGIINGTNGIGSLKNLYMNGGKINVERTAISSDRIPTIIIGKDSQITASTGIEIHSNNSNYGKITIKDEANIKASSIGIESRFNNIHIKDKAVVEGLSNKAVATNNNVPNNLTIGEKDNDVSTTYPKIISNNISTDINFNFYDGILVNKKNNFVSAAFNDIEENHEILFKEEDSEKENITLSQPTKENFGDVAQIGDTKYSSLKEAINSITTTEETKIKLLKDFPTALNYNINGKNIVLDLNGHKLIKYVYGPIIINNATFKLTDSSSTVNDGIVTLGSGQLLAYQGYILRNNSNMTTENIYILLNTDNIYNASGIIYNTGNYHNIDTNLDISKNGYIYGYNALYNLGEATIDGGNITAYLLSDYNWSGQTIYNNGTLTINRGYVRGGSRAILSEGDNNNLIINGGTFRSYTDFYNLFTSAIYKNGGPKATINNAVISQSYGGLYLSNTEADITNLTVNSSNTGIYLNSSNATLNSGTINSSSTGVNTYNGTFSMLGGTINSNGTGISLGENAIVNIYDGKIKGTYNGINTSNNGKATINIGEKDGFVSTTSPEIIGENYSAIYNYNNLHTVNFYDGILKSKTKTADGNISSLEDGYQRLTGVENDYKTEYLGKLPIAEIYDTNDNLIEKACNNDECYSLQDAIDYSENGYKIKLIQNISLTSEENAIIPEDKIIIIDFNSKTINGNNIIENNGNLTLIGTLTSETEEYLITNNNILNIKDLNVKENKSYIVNNNGTLNVDGFTATASDTIISNSGTVELDNIDFKLSSYGTAIRNNQGKITINSGLIDAYTNNVYYYAYGINNNGELIINNIDGIGSHNFLINTSNGILTINGGTLTTKSSSAVIDNEGILTINDGNITNTNSGSCISSSGEVTINNGYLYSKASNTIRASKLIVLGGTIKNASEVAINTSSTLTIGTKDGIVNKESPVIISERGTAINADSNAIISLYDGVIKGVIPVSRAINIVETNYQIIDDNENYKISEEETVELNIRYLDQLPFAEIYKENGDKKNDACTNGSCYTLQEAINSSSNTDIIKVIRNAEFSDEIPIATIDSGKIINLNTNSYSLNVNGLAENNGTLNITGNGTISTRSEYVVKNNGTLNLENINMYGVYTYSESNYKVIYNNGTLNITNSNLYDASSIIYNTENGNMTINSGLLSTSNRNTTIENYGNVVINNGTMYGGSSNSYGHKPVIINRKTMEINNGTINGSIYSYDSLDINNGNINDIYSSGTINVKDGRINELSQEGTATITGGTINSIGSTGTLNFASATVNDISSSSSSILNISSGTINNQVNISTSETVNITGGIFNGTSTAINISSTGIVNIKNINLNKCSTCITNSSTGIVNLTENIAIDANDIAINNTGTGTINIGVNNENPSLTDPSIKGKNIGVYNKELNGKINWYDGVLIGPRYNSINGTYTTLNGYTKKTSLDEETNIETSVLNLSGSATYVVSMNGNNYESLEAAMQSASTSEDNSLVLYQTINLESNITVPDNATIIVETNGFNINKNGFNFIGNNITIKDKNNNDLLATIRELLNLGTLKVKKNIVVFNDDNGNILDSSQEYTLKLKVENGYEKIDVEENKNIGRYIIATRQSDKKIRTTDGNVYLNDISEGEYILEASNGNKSTFVINEDGSVSGNIRTTYVDNELLTSNNVLASSEADIIVNIQTGQKVVRYGIILLIITSIMSVLILLKRRTKEI